MRAYERLLNYVRVHTTSDENSGTHPSAEREFDLARQLVEEMKALGMEDAHVDEHCYVYGTLPATPGCEDQHALGLIAHMDTADDASGENVQPVVWENYNGGDVTLPATGMVMKPSVFPFLTSMKGETLITSDGTTLLGADDKAGIAEIVSAMVYLKQHPEIKHGKIRVGFNPDEEIGMGAHLFDVEKFGCDWAYTMDGGEVGELEFENFNAASAHVTVKGLNVHPGYAKNKMINSNYIAAEFVRSMPLLETPEQTDGYEGFFHLMSMQGTVEKTELTYIIRDHDRKRFEERKQYVQKLVEQFNKKYGEGTVSAEVSDQYYNMREVVEPSMHIIDVAQQAMQDCGIPCEVKAIRGGTDGAQLSFKGLPCPNIFAGGLNFHGRHEFIPVASLTKAMNTIVRICELVPTLDIKK